MTAALLCLLLAGCLALDHTPLEEQPFYGAARQVLEGLAIPPDGSGPLRAGAARVEITPPAGVPLGGHGGRRSTGIHDPVFARALVLANGRATLALVSADLLAIPGPLAEAVTRTVEAELAVPAEGVMVAATHTHSGPGALGRRLWEQAVAGRFDPSLFEQTVRRMAGAVAEASRRLEPVWLTERRFEAPDLVANRRVPGGPVDPEVRVLVLESQASPRRSYLVNFAAHATVLGEDNRLVSGDYPGYLCRALEEAGDAVALFTAGAVADQRPRPPAGGSALERAEGLGRLLAERVRSAPPLAPPRDRAVLWARAVSVPLPPPQIRATGARRLPQWLGRLFLDFSARFQVMGEDRVLLAGIPGEVSAQVGLAWKARARAAGRELTVVGLANGYAGYVVSAQRYAGASYEARMALHGPHLAEYLGRFLEPFLGPQARP